jgi:hypothetical protein
MERTLFSVGVVLHLFQARERNHQVTALAQLVGLQISVEMRAPKSLLKTRCHASDVPSLGLKLSEARWKPWPDLPVPGVRRWADARRSFSQPTPSFHGTGCPNLSALNLHALRLSLREKNLHHPTRDGRREAGIGLAVRALAFRMTDGQFNDLRCPMMGAAHTGSWPLSLHVHPEPEAPMEPSPRKVTNSSWQTDFNWRAP